MVRLILHSRVPMFILWSDDLIQLYNDAYRKLLGTDDRHPRILGQKAEESWPDAWEVIKPLIDKAMQGDSVGGEDMRVPLNRNGRWIDTYWSLDYSPLYDDADRPAGVLLTCQETTETVQNRRKLLETRNQALAFFEQSPVGFAILSREGLTFQMVNSFYCRLVGREPDQLVGKSLRSALPELADQGFDQLLEKVMETGSSHVSSEVPIQLLRGNRTETLYVDVTYQPLRDDDRITGVLVVVGDVTRQVESRRKVQESGAHFRALSEQLDQLVQQRTEELRISNKELAASNYALKLANVDLVRTNERLQSFVYVASHDLQEPLRKIQAFGDVLQSQFQDNLSEGERDMTGRIQKSAGRMQQLIKDLLTYSQVGVQRNADKPIPLNQIVEDVVSDLEVLIRESSARVEVGSLPTVLGTASRLRQLIQNLLSNAIKFRQPERPLLIRINARPAIPEELPGDLTRHEAYWLITVSDNGIGFDEKYKNRIFQPFQRLHHGTGIGLAICHRVMETLDGAIEVSSRPDEGTTFRLFVPVYQSAE